MDSNPHPQTNPSEADGLESSLQKGEGDSEGGNPDAIGRRMKRWTPPTPKELAELMPGYEIDNMLGRGGMGAVYKGLQSALNRTVAIKILSSDLEDLEGDFGERFQNEARAMAKLEHPGIVSVYGFGQTKTGLLYIVMEYVEGTDVARIIAEQGQLRTEFAIGITAHVCDAMAFAHERGIIHRDIKPANIMVGYDGVVRVTDFGLAKAQHIEGESASLTQSGMVLGTMHYIAPEMLVMKSHEVDQRADIYAVGVMLYHMLTGKVPQGMFELPSQQVEELDPRYDGIITKAMQEDREERYRTTAAMRSDLDAVLIQPIAHVASAVGSEGVPAAILPSLLSHRPAGRELPDQSSSISEMVFSGRTKWITACVGVAFLAVNAAGWWWVKQGGKNPVEAIFRAQSVLVPKEEEAKEDDPNRDEQVASSNNDTTEETIELAHSEEAEDEDSTEMVVTDEHPTLVDPFEIASSSLDHIVRPLLGVWWQRTSLAPTKAYRLVLAEDGDATLEEGEVTQNGSWMILGDRLVFSWENGIESQMPLEHFETSKFVYGTISKDDNVLGEFQLARLESKPFRLADWHLLPELPKTPCRLVIVKHPGGIGQPGSNCFQRIEEEDRVNLVKLGEVFQMDDVVALDSFGAPVSWASVGGGVLQTREPCVSVFSLKREFPRILWLTKEGRIGGLPEDNSIIQNLGGLNEVVHMRTIGKNLVFVITRDGARHFVGGSANPKTRMQLEKRLQNIDDFAPSGNNWVHVAYDEGDWAIYKSSKLANYHENTGAKRYLTSTIQLRENGKLLGHTHGWNVAIILNRWPNLVEQVSNTNFSVAARATGEDWRFLFRNQGGRGSKWIENQRYAQAFQGATEVRVAGGYVYALLPAQSVSRSGLWNLDELILDRKSLASRTGL